MEYKRIAVMTSGGDAPGLNAAIRAVVRSGLYYGMEVYGVQRGYDGLVEGDFMKMEASTVSNIIHRGGTILKSSRSPVFKTEEGRRSAKEQLDAAGIEAVILIGGDGSFCGARAFTSMFDMPWIGIPKTIDNDLYGTDYTIGYDTAINTAMQAIDRIRDTAESHNRLFLIEVMGRDAGFIAARAGIAGGAEAVLIPESKSDFEHFSAILETGWNRKKNSVIAVVAEGDEAGGVYKIAEQIKKKHPSYDVGVCVLGHTQRGGSPTCHDRVLGSRLGIAAIEALLEGKRNIMVGEIKGDIAYTPFEQAVKQNLAISPQMLRLLEMLAH